MMEELLVAAVWAGVIYGSIGLAMLGLAVLVAGPKMAKAVLVDDPDGGPLFRALGPTWYALVLVWTAAVYWPGVVAHAWRKHRGG